MIDKLWNRFCNFPFFVQLVWVLCALGLLADLYLLGRDVFSGGLLWRLHLGFALLYASQIAFILLREKWVCALTVLQGVLALLTNADFIFMPLLRLLGNMYYLFSLPTVQGLKIYKYVLISLAFTLQLYTALRLFSELQSPTVQQSAD